MSSYLADVDANLHFGTLANGLRYVHYRNHGDPRGYLSYLTKVGARYESEEQLGISHLLEHMMFRGSRRFDDHADLARAFEALGGEWNAGTGHEHSEFWYQGNSQCIPDAIELFGEFLSYPKLKGIRQEKRIVATEIAQEYGVEHGVLEMDQLIVETLWPGHPLTHPILGTVDSVNAIVKSDLEHHRAVYYGADRSVVGVAADIEPSEIQGYLEEHFANIAPAKNGASELKPPKLAKGQKFHAVDIEDDGYQVALAFACPGENGKVSHQLDLLCRILSDGYSALLGHKLRETYSLVYDVQCVPIQYSDCGYLSIQTWVGADHLEALVEALAGVCSSLSERAITDEHLELAKRRALMGLELLPSRQSDLVFRAGWGWMAGKKARLSKVANHYSDVKLDELRMTASQIFTADRAALVLLGPSANDMKDSVNHWIDTIGGHHGRKGSRL